MGNWKSHTQSTNQDNRKEYILENGSHIHNVQYQGNRRIVRAIYEMMSVTYTTWNIKTMKVKAVNFAHVIIYL